uniref:UBA domain-containing protein n=1 Tax=Caedibacter taeniospiralis TaxID=28907 RepID=Q6TFF2_CAETA|nr:helix-turn-helix domain-containing protein [Caedibacter taeniospiralis]AAR87107.1 hypothetical protein [Caedibacter taeniospiralis]
MNQIYHMKQTQVLNDEEKDMVKIPKSYFLLEGVSLIQVGLLSKIKMLSSNDEGVCYASDDFFAKFFNMCKKSIKRHIDKLASFGYLHRKKDLNNNSILQRKIWVVDEAIKRNIQKKNKTELKITQNCTNQGFLDKTGKKMDKTGKKMDKTGKKMDKTGKKMDKTGKKMDKTGKKMDKPCIVNTSQTHTLQGVDSSLHKNTEENKRSIITARKEILQTDESHYAENVTDFDDDFFCFSELMDMGFSSENAMGLIKKHGKNKIEQGFETIYNENKKSKIHNLAGYLCKLLENGFKPLNTNDTEVLNEEKQAQVKQSEENFEIINKWWRKNGLTLQYHLNTDLKASRKLAFELKDIILYNPTSITKKSLDELLNGKIATIQSIEKFAEAIIAQKDDEIKVENTPDLEEKTQPNQPLKNDENLAENAIVKHIQKHGKITD